MRNQTVRLFLYSSLAIVVMTLIWGFRQIPRQGHLAEDQLRSSLEQELVMLTSATQAATSAMNYRLLDVLKAEGNDHSTRAFQESPFVTAALLEWDSSQWKILWDSHKLNDQFQNADLQKWITSWPLAKIQPGESFFIKAGDVQGQAYFALVVPVRKPGNIPMLGIGVFQASQFGLSFSAETSREVRVFDGQGYALALAHPAYIGASVKAEPIVDEILDTDMLSVREQWKSERGVPMMGLAQKMSDSNLAVAIETKSILGSTWYWKAWFYLLICAAGAIALNWVLFNSLVKPLFHQLAQTEELAEKWRRQLMESPVLTAPPVPMIIPSAELPNESFVEATRTPEPEIAEVEPVPTVTTLAKLVNSSLRSLDSQIQAAGISINRIGLEEVEVEGDVLQLSTAIEEVLKNAIEAMQGSSQGQLTITAHRHGDRLQLMVEDTGRGVSQENLDKVFDPFFSTKDSQGVARGLGLNVVRRVIEELEGTVSLRNRVGQSGVSVEIDWPVAPLKESVPSPSMAPSDLDFINEDDSEADDFSRVQVTPPRDWPDVAIRKPKVRTLD